MWGCAEIAAGYKAPCINLTPLVCSPVFPSLWHEVAWGWVEVEYVLYSLLTITGFCYTLYVRITRLSTRSVSLTLECEPKYIDKKKLATKISPNRIHRQNFSVNKSNDLGRYCKILIKPRSFTEQVIRFSINDSRQDPATVLSYYNRFII